MMKRWIALLLALTLTVALLGGCSGAASSAGAGRTDPPASATPAPTPTPTPTPEPYEANVLTGFEKDASYPEGQRITAVMVNNLTSCRPQRGLSAAQVLFEIKVEGGITRFMALFNDYNEIPTIGPIRSARDQFFRLVLPWQPLYVHIGQSVVQKEYIDNYQYDEWNIEGNYDSAFWWRNRDRRNWAGNSVATEHTAYTDGEHIADYIQRKQVDDRRTYNSTFFNFVDYREPPRTLDGTPAGRVTIRHSASYRTRFVYDEALSQYRMSQFYSPLGDYRDSIDENNEQQLAFDNLVILFTDIHTYPGHEAKDLQYAEYSWGGVGYYCYGGQVIPIRWTKGTDLEGLVLYDYDMTAPLEINCGKTYITVVDIDEAASFVTEALEEAAPDLPEQAIEETFEESDD